MLADVAVTLAVEGAADRRRTPSWRQDGLEDRLAELERAPLRRRRSGASSPRSPIRAAGSRSTPARSAAAPAPGDPVGRLRIPAIGLRTVVVEGTDPDELRDGPGHYPDTVLPGERGTVALAGHRTTYGAPFRRRRRARPRRPDRASTTPYGTFTYRVDATRIVPATAVGVVGDKAYDRLVLTACHPLFSADERIVVSARLERAVPA